MLTDEPRPAAYNQSSRLSISGIPDHLLAPTFSVWRPRRPALNLMIWIGSFASCSDKNNCWTVKAFSFLPVNFPATALRKVCPRGYRCPFPGLIGVSWIESRFTIEETIAINVFPDFPQASYPLRWDKSPCKNPFFPRNIHENAGRPPCSWGLPSKNFFQKAKHSDQLLFLALSALKVL